MDWAYIELEAMRFFHYGLRQWKREPAPNRRRLIVHFLEHGIRESYTAEQISEAAAKEAPAPAGSNVSSFFAYRQGGGKE